MNLEPSEELVLKHVKRQQGLVEAKAVLAGSKTIPYAPLVGAAALAVALWALIGSGLSGAVQTLLAVCFVTVVAVAIEQWAMRRRLEAAILVLLAAN